MVVLLFAIAFGSASAHAQDCATRARNPDLAARLESAESALVDIDDAGFGRSLDEAALLLPCLGDALTPDLAARYHRMQGLRLFSAGEEGGALASMRAARVVDPAYRFPDEILDPSNALRQKYDALPPAEGAVEGLPRARSGSLRFDGADSQDRPLERSTLVQVLDPNGAVQTSAYLYPGAPMVPYDAVPRARNRFLAGAGISLLASGALYGAAWGVHGATLDRDNDKIDDLGDLERRQAQTIALTGASSAFLVGGVGLSVGALLSGR